MAEQSDGGIPEVSSILDFAPRVRCVYKPSTIVRDGWCFLDSLKRGKKSLLITFISTNRASEGESISCNLGCHGDQVWKGQSSMIPNQSFVNTSI